MEFRKMCSGHGISDFYLISFDDVDPVRLAMANLFHGL